jgi:hypothetical protein
MDTMDSNERVKRPEPQRTQPIRNWWTLFGPPGSMPPSGPGMPMPGMPGMPGARPSAPGDAVSQGVQMGYRVIEEYMRQGQNAARSFGMPYGPGAMPGMPGGMPGMPGGMPGGAMPGMPGMPGGMPGMPGGAQMETLFRSFSDFMGMWMQVMGRGMPGAPDAAPRATGPAQASGVAGPFAMPDEPATPAPQPQPASAPMPRPHAPASVAQPSEAQVALTLELESPRRTEVSFDLRPRSLGLPLVVHDLRAPEADKPRISGVVLETVPDEERLILRLRIPAEQPPGIYSGIILDERTSLPRGTLTVRLAP